MVKVLIRFKDTKVERKIMIWIYNGYDVKVRGYYNSHLMVKLEKVEVRLCLWSRETTIVCSSVKIQQAKQKSWSIIDFPSMGSITIICLLY